MQSVLEEMDVVTNQIERVSFIQVQEKQSLHKRIWAFRKYACAALPSFHIQSIGSYFFLLGYSFDDVLKREDALIFLRVNINAWATAHFGTKKN